MKPELVDGAEPLTQVLEAADRLLEALPESVVEAADIVEERNLLRAAIEQAMRGTA